MGAPADDILAATEFRVGFDGRMGRAHAFLRDRQGRQAGGAVALGPWSARANRIGRPAGPQEVENQIRAANDLGCELQDFVAELDSIVHVVHQAADLGLQHHIEEMMVEHGAHPFERSAGDLGSDAVPRGPALHQLLDGR